MKIIYNKNDKAPDQPTEKEESRISRLINRLDLKDQSLDPEKRKRKWVYILSGIFVLYLLSFLVPSPKLLHHSLNAENKTIAKGSVSKGNTPKAQKPQTFEMPVDSFENILKNNIHEKLSKKK
jgi:hypothetical protein